MKPFLHFFFFCVLLFSCCKPDESVDCPEAQTTIVNISAADKAKIPYTGFDTLKFIGINGDSQILIGHGQQMQYDDEFLFVHPSCPQNQIQKNESILVEYEPIKGNLSFQMLLKEKTWSVGFKVKNYPIQFLSSLGTLGIRTNSQDPNFYDSIQVGNIMYYNVRKFYVYDLQAQIEQADTSYSLLFNKSKGVLLIKNHHINQAYSRVP